jgi:hypothetical protein
LDQLFQTLQVRDVLGPFDLLTAVVAAGDDGAATERCHVMPEMRR